MFNATNCAAHPLHNFEIQMYYENEPKFDSKDGAYVIKIDEYKSIGTH